MCQAPCLHNYGLLCTCSISITQYLIPNITLHDTYIYMHAIGELYMRYDVLEKFLLDHWLLGLNDLACMVLVMACQVLVYIRPECKQRHNVHGLTEYRAVHSDIWLGSLRVFIHTREDT